MANDVYNERTAKKLLDVFREIWCERATDEEPHFNCDRCEFQEGMRCKVKTFLIATHYVNEPPQGSIMNEKAVARYE